MKFLKKLSDLLPVLLVLIGCITISVGVALLNLAAGIICAGASALAAGILMIIGGPDDDKI